jgi:hypothetical protein
VCGKKLISFSTVAHHGTGAYRPGKSGGDSENTPDTKPGVWAAPGRGGVRHVQNQNQKNRRKEPEAMNTSKIRTAKINGPQEPCRFTKRLGSTAYRVVVHFNPDTKDTAGEKIARLVRNEAAAGKAANQ